MSNLNTNNTAISDDISNDDFNDYMDGMCIIDTCDIDNARLVLARAVGMPEPVLYDDTPIPLMSYDVEGVLNTLIDIQARMHTGMSMINACEDVLTKANEGTRLSYDVFTSWVDRKRHLWSHWWVLVGECKALASECPSVWPKYFQYCGDQGISPYFTSTVVEEYDATRNYQVDHGDNRALSTIDALMVGHIEEQQELLAYNS